ncbi:unnamed protein product, partial [Brenthis ino]
MIAECTFHSSDEVQCNNIFVPNRTFLTDSLNLRSTPEDNSYVAAVVAYELQSNSATNLQNYMNIIGDAAEQNADIIVFPELAISNRETVVVPINGLLKEHPIPALQPELFGEVLVSISSAARHHQIYVVINVQEFLNCTIEATGENCPENKNYVFNTNVVFDRAGAVIDRYRKINLFGEVNRTATLTPDLGIFTTDFGITFGHFICFDIMYQVPAVQVVLKYNVTDVIFTTKWYSEMPYLTAVQIQEAYAYVMNVNFLGAGANNVRVGNGGSGIYSGKAGALVSIMPGISTTKLLVSRVPKVPGQVEGDYPGPMNDGPLVLDSLVLRSDPSLPSYVTRLIKPGLEEFTLIDKDVVCRFKIHMSERHSDTAPYYRAL